VAPLAEKRFSSGIAADAFYGVDMTSTGSIGSGKTYTVRKSVLQSVPGATCTISGDGRRIGDC
jgi:type II secretory pathway predicted ATPase ExeA